MLKSAHTFACTCDFKFFTLVKFLKFVLNQEKVIYAIKYVDYQCFCISTGAVKLIYQHCVKANH